MWRWMKDYLEIPCRILNMTFNSAVTSYWLCWNKHFQDAFTRFFHILPTHVYPALFNVVALVIILRKLSAPINLFKTNKRQKLTLCNVSSILCNVCGINKLWNQRTPERLDSFDLGFNLYSTFLNVECTIKFYIKKYTIKFYIS